MRLKLRPQEVTEVARIQAKKIWSKILKSAIFELHIKKKLKTIVFQNQSQIIDFLLKNIIEIVNDKNK